MNLVSSMPKLNSIDFRQFTFDEELVKEMFSFIVHRSGILHLSIRKCIFTGNALSTLFRELSSKPHVLKTLSFDGLSKTQNIADDLIQLMITNKTLQKLELDWT